LPNFIVRAQSNFPARANAGFSTATFAILKSPQLKLIFFKCRRVTCHVIDPRRWNGRMPHCVSKRKELLLARGKDKERSVGDA
jgi:hypothetical protein